MARTHTHRHCMKTALSIGNVILGAYRGHVETCFGSRRIWISSW